ncbi:MAG: hypothetical protein ACI3YI_05375 [Bacteroidaceae bacterium]
MEEKFDITDILLERPHGFSVKKKKFYLYPQTLGVQAVIQSIAKSLDIDMEILGKNPALESLRLVELHKAECCRIISYSTFKTKEEIYDLDKVMKRSRFFEQNLDNEGIAMLVLHILTSDKTAKAMNSLGIDKEQNRLRKIISVTDNKHSVNVGGVSAYGTLIDAACERYGWTFDYVVWGVTYTNLRLLLADKITQLYLSDDELKKARRYTHKAVRADSEEGRRMIRDMDWS